MREEFVFQPPRRRGLVFHAGAILFFVAIGALGLFQAANASVGPVFLLYLAPSLLAVVTVSLLAYRVYALQNAYYILERDGIRLRWGLRSEDIPMTDISWVHPVSELTTSLPLPWMRWPGAVLGVRHLSDSSTVEFLAASSRDLILIATPERAFSISPTDKAEFLDAFQRCTEMGSLMPLAARSVYPSFLLIRVWSTKPARLLLLASWALSLALLIWVSITISARAQIPLGFTASGSPGEAGPSVRLFLLPVINTFFILVDLLLGLFFFRREESQPLAYLLWGGGAFTPLLFLMAVFFILQTG